MEWEQFLLVIAPVLAGPFIGSFMAAAASRWGGPESVLSGRSRCDSCRHVLGPAEIIPLVSYAALGGRCRSCAALIPPLHPAIELAALGVAAFSAVVMPSNLVWLSAALGWTLLLLSAIDLRLYILPDALTLPLIVAGLLFRVLTQGEDWPYYAAGAVVGWAGGAVLAALYERVSGRAGLGGGDVKLFAAAGAWLGLIALPSVMLIGAGSGLVIVLLARARGFAISRTTPIPFGPFLAFGFYVVWLFGPLNG